MEAQKSRPSWVWVIAIWKILVLIGVPFLYYLIFSGKIHLKPIQRTFFETNDTVSYILQAAMILLEAVGAIYLFRLKKQALPLFIAALFARIPLLLWHFYLQGTVFVREETPSTIAIGLLTTLVVIAYVAHLSKKHILT